MSRDMPAITCHAVVERIEVLAYNVKSFRLRLAEPKAMPFEAGQFIIMHVPKDGSTVKRAYSIASPPHEAGVVELCIQHVDGGIASTYFWKLTEGAPVTVSGPHGKFLLKQPVDYQPVFMGTGTGVAPFRSMIKHLYHQGVSTEMWLLFGCRYEHTLLYEAEFRALASMRRGFHYVPTVSRPKEWKGETGHIQETFRKHITDFSNKEIWICGWMEIVKSIVRDLESYGVPPAQIHYEEWA
jgi:NAD(P)H-flavin reductase